MFKTSERVVVTFKNGERRAGRVNYVRMAPPDFSKPEVYSVILDGVDHAGTVVLAEQVSKE